MFWKKSRQGLLRPPDQFLIDGDADQYLEEWEIQGMQIIGLLGTAVPVVFFDDRLTVAQQHQASSGRQTLVNVIERIGQTGRVDVLGFRLRRTPLFLVKMKCLFAGKSNYSVYPGCSGYKTDQVKRYIFEDVFYRHYTFCAPGTSNRFG